MLAPGRKIASQRRVTENRAKFTQLPRRSQGKYAVYLYPMPQRKLQELPQRFAQKLAQQRQSGQREVDSLEWVPAARALALAHDKNDGAPRAAAAARALFRALLCFLPTPQCGPSLARGSRFFVASSHLSPRFRLPPGMLALGEMHPFTKSVLRSNPLARFFSRMIDDASSASAPPPSASAAPSSAAADGLAGGARPGDAQRGAEAAEASPASRSQQHEAGSRGKGDVVGRVPLPLLPPVLDAQAAAALAKTLALQAEGPGPGEHALGPGRRRGAAQPAQQKQPAAAGAAVEGPQGGLGDGDGEDDDDSSDGDAAAPGGISLGQLKDVVRAALIASEGPRGFPPSSKSR